MVLIYYYVINEVKTNINFKINVSLWSIIGIILDYWVILPYIIGIIID